jgi:hypothetical protein
MTNQLRSCYHLLPLSLYAFCKVLLTWHIGDDNIVVNGYNVYGFCIPIEEDKSNYRVALPVLLISYLHVSYITFAKYMTNTTIVG